MRGSGDAIQIMGIPASPYTRKMVAVMRYRHIPYALISRKTAQELKLVPATPSFLPTVYLPDDAGTLQPLTDTTPLIRMFEKSHPERSAVPSDPVLALIDRIIEDYADEWVTKPMFHYRWVYEADIQQSTNLLPLWFDRVRPDVEVRAMGEQFAERQIDRLGVVGSNAQTGPLIEASYKRLLVALDEHLAKYPFLLGQRPASGDFGLYGQLTQLAMFDPTPMQLTLATAPRVHAWTAVVDDLSGLDPQPQDWIDPGSIPDTLMAILREIGRTYVPVMLANAKAVADGADTVEAVVDGVPWRQVPFRYQAKCLRWLQEAHDALDATDQTRVRAILADTGCDALFQPSGRAVMP